jgi:hypothetical protein
VGTGTNDIIEFEILSEVLMMASDSAGSDDAANSIVAHPLDCSKIAIGSVPGMFLEILLRNRISILPFQSNFGSLVREMATLKQYERIVAANSLDVVGPK